MKRNGVVGGLLVVGITLWLGLGHAQPLTNTVVGLEWVPAGQLPLYGSFWSMANPKSPPCPSFMLRDLGQDAPPVYALGPPGEFLVDDRGVADSVFLAQNAALSSSEAGPQSLISGPDYGCGLWLDISAISNNPSAVLLTLHNSRTGQSYDRAPSNPYWYHFPSLAANCSGDMVAGFSGSSLTNYIGAFWFWRLADGSTPQHPRVIQAGLTRFTDPDGPRWGDFSTTASDPADDSSFWTVQQYADPAGADEFGNYPWKTVIARIRLIP
jgi:hypothetical protein